MPGGKQTMPKRGRQIQRNCLGFGEAPDAEAAQRDDMAKRTERRGEIAGKRADVGALANGGFEFGMVGGGNIDEAQRVDRDRALRENRRLAGAGKGIGATASDFDRRIGWRALRNRAGEARQYGLDG